jgi:uncharacterized repeat protein (TIGR01451 family)
MKHKHWFLHRRELDNNSLTARRLNSGTVLLSLLTVTATIFSLFLVNPSTSASADTGEGSSSDGSTLVTEDFTKNSASDKRWVVPNQADGSDSSKTNAACLTAASSATAQPDPAAESSLWYCRRTTGSSYLTGTAPGFLQLTDASGGQTGSVLYNRALPTAAGLDISFYQYQFGGSGADGIGFYLTNGSYDLSKTGPTGSGVGGALGYGSITTNNTNNGDTSKWVSGIDQGVLGVGLDKFGNFSRPGYVGVNCSGQTDTGNRVANSVTLRGSGNGTDGYCMLATKQLSSSDPQIATSAPTAATEGQNNGTLVRIVISPETASDPYPTVTVYLNGTAVESYTMTTALPPTVKFGFTASTGGATDVHLIRTVTVKSVTPMGSISLVKTVNHDTSNGGTTKTAFTAGDDIPYSFLVTNTGDSTLDNISVTDPKVTGITCPTTTLSPTDSMVCTGTYSSVTKSEEQTGYVTNTATATGTPQDTGTPVNSTPSTVQVPTYSQNPFSLAKQVEGSGASAAVDDSYTINYSYPAGNYQYCDTTGTAHTSTDNAGQFSGVTNGTLTVKGGQTATSNPIPIGAIVTLSEADSNIAGATWASTFDPSKTLTIGCSTSANAVTLTNTYTQQTGSVSWSKTDKADGSALAGSQWTLTGPDGKSVTVVDNGENDADDTAGSLKVSGLAWGAYKLVEAKAPTGYTLDSTSHAFTVDAGDLSVDLGKITNARATGSVSWSKTDKADGSALAGSQWTLTGPDGKSVTVVDNGENDADDTAGSLKVSGLAWGAYKLVEAKAPTGYTLDSTSHAFTVDAGDLSVDLGKITNARATGSNTPTTHIGKKHEGSNTRKSNPLATTGADIAVVLIVAIALAILGVSTFVLKRHSETNR